MRDRTLQMAADESEDILLHLGLKAEQDSLFVDRNKAEFERLLRIYKLTGDMKLLEAMIALPIV